MQGGPQSQSGRVPQLDGLRGIAVSLVVLFHYTDGLANVPVVGPVVSRGWIGVDLFFVMSGFLIGGIVIANKDAANLFSVFYARRSLRIFPLYYLLLGAVTILTAVHLMPAAEHGLGFYVVYAQNVMRALTGDPGPGWLQPTWSLAMEEQFYLLLPALVVLTPSRYLPGALALGIVIPITMRLRGYALPVAHPSDFALFFSLCRCDGLFYGVHLAWMVRNGSTSVPVKLRVAGCYIGLVILFLVFILASRTDLLFTIGLSLLGPMFFCVVAVSVMHENGPVSRLTKSSALRWLGTRTYSIYLFHMPVLSSFNKLFELTKVNSHGLNPLLALGVTLGCATASWYLIEAPLIKRGHRLK
jgi:peptidoglycan/LPS O-acetylase OafA/YrhL